MISEGLSPPPQKSRRSGKRRLVRLIAVLCASILLAAVVLEVFIRLFDPFGVSHFSDMPKYFSELCELTGPPRILRHKVETTLEFRDFSITTNRLGLRGPELSEEKPGGEYRILFLGDSVVLGWGMEEEKTFPALAERELNELAVGGRRYRCVNGGHNQYDTTQEAAFLFELGDRIRPDAVVLVYVNNDVIPTIETYNALQKQAEELRKRKPGLLARAMNWCSARLSEWFKGINNLLRLANHIRTMAKAVEQERSEQSGRDATGWEASRKALMGIRDWCRERGTPFVVLNHSFPGDGDKPAEVPPLVPFLEKEGIPHFPFHFTQEEQKMDLRRSFSDAHANERGHRLLLEKLRPALRSLGL